MAFWGGGFTTGGSSSNMLLEACRARIWPRSRSVSPLSSCRGSSYCGAADRTAFTAGRTEAGAQGRAVFPLRPLSAFAGERYSQTCYSWCSYSPAAAPAAPAHPRHITTHTLPAAAATYVARAGQKHSPLAEQQRERSAGQCSLSTPAPAGHAGQTRCPG